VIHDFFVPPLRIKQDAVPGMKIDLHFTANKAGRYEVACAELCGLGHYKMKSFMDVVSQDEFDRWLKDKAASR
jgi:cytochrome c oxidase subunit 2